MEGPGGVVASFRANNRKTGGSILAGAPRF